MKLAISVPIGAWHKQLPTTISSLILQRADLEIAILDASNDSRVRGLIEQFSTHFAYVRHGPDHGQSDAIIEGWENTKSDWLGWLNADDALLPGAIKKVRNRLQDDPSIDVLYGHSIIRDDDDRFIGYHFNVEPPGPRLLEAGIISQPSCFFRRGAYDRIGGLNRDLHYVMDWDLWIRMYRDNAKFAFINQPLS
ncbi:MAG: glycosyltransferase, partial [Pseudomonadota bacterium]